MAPTKLSKSLPAHGRAATPRAGSYDLKQAVVAGLAQVPFDTGMPKSVADAFPAPKPDVARVRKVRRICGGPRTTIGITIPPECAYVAGFRQGDQVVISAWREGCLRVVRAEAEAETKEKTGKVQKGVAL